MLTEKKMFSKSSISVWVPTKTLPYQNFHPKHGRAYGPTLLLEGVSIFIQYDPKWLWFCQISAEVESWVHKLKICYEGLGYLSCWFSLYLLFKVDPSIMDLHPHYQVGLLFTLSVGPIQPDHANYMQKSKLWSITGADPGNFDGGGQGLGGHVCHVWCSINLRDGVNNIPRLHINPH